MRDHEWALDELYQAYLANVYQGVQRVPRPKTDREYWRQRKVSPAYGEMLYPSVKKMMNKFCSLSAGGFLDLGSGLGKLALQIFMQSGIKKVLGIEALTELSEQAKNVVRRVRVDCPFFWEDSRDLRLVTGNFLTEDWEGASIVYACSTCFRTELLEAIGDRINVEMEIKQAFTLNPFPTLKRLTLKEVFTVECSWDTALCYHYTEHKGGSNESH